MTKYLQLEGKTGRIYEYSKTEKEGFEKYESSKGNVSFRRYLNTGLYGVLQNVSVRDSKIGKQIEVAVKNDGDFHKLQLPLYSQSGDIENRYAESLIRFLPNLKKGQGYRFYPYAIDQEDSDYKMYGVSVIESPNPEAEEKGAKIEPHLTYSKEPSKDTDIPNLEWKEIAGKKKPSAVSLEKKNEFLYEYLTKATDGHLAYDGQTQSSNQSQSQNDSKPESKVDTEVPVTGGDEDDDYDDLPF